MLLPHYTDALASLRTASLRYTKTGVAGSGDADWKVRPTHAGTAVHAASASARVHVPLPQSLPAAR